MIHRLVTASWSFALILLVTGCAGPPGASPRVDLAMLYEGDTPRAGRAMRDVLFPMDLVLGTEVCTTVKTFVEGLDQSKTLSSQNRVDAANAGRDRFTVLAGEWECELASGYTWLRNGTRLNIRLRTETLSTILNATVMTYLQTEIKDLIDSILSSVSNLTAGQIVANTAVWNEIDKVVSEAMGMNASSGWVCTYVRGQGMRWVNVSTGEVDGECFPP